MAPVELTISVIPSGARCLLGAAEPGTFNAGQLVLLGMAVVALTLVMLSTRRRIRKSQRQKVTDPLPLVSSALREQNQAARNLEEVMLELDELSRQIHGASATSSGLTANLRACRNTTWCRCWRLRSPRTRSRGSRA